MSLSIWAMVKSLFENGTTNSSVEALSAVIGEPDDTLVTDMECCRNRCQTVPTVDNSNNSKITDVIGNKDDTLNGTTIVAFLKKITELINDAVDSLECVFLDYNNIIRVYPSLTSPITLTTGSSSWQLGSASTIVDSNVITKDFRIVQINIGDVSTKSTYEVFLYIDTSGVLNLLGHGRTLKESNIAEVKWINCISPVVAANSKIVGKVASADGNNATIKVSLTYKQRDN